MLYRDDDISKYTDLTTIMRIQELFVKYNKIHTVTILMEDLWESRGVWEWLISTPNLDIALHGWNHKDYSELCYVDTLEEIRKSLTYWERNLERLDLNIPIKVMYPPWNKSSDKLAMVCDELGLELNVNVDDKEVFNFHWWEFIGGKNLDKLEKVLSG